jgi:hypothetical protein
MCSDWTVRHFQEYCNIQSFIFPPKLAPIFSIHPEIDAANINKDQVKFFYVILTHTIDAYINGDFSYFDAHTASTCCHGVALLAMSLIEEANLDKVIQIKNQINSVGVLDHHLLVPGYLIWLARLFILNRCKLIDFNRGYITDLSGLNSILNLSGRFYSNLIKLLQKKVANIVCARYKYYSSNIPKYIKIHNVSIRLWEKYVAPPYIRASSNFVFYASNFFSMRVVLSYLSFNFSYIALINDCINEFDVLKERYIVIYKGDGKGGFDFITSSESDEILNFINIRDPVFILGGVAYIRDYDNRMFFCTMEHWKNKILDLVCACDVWYPQFPIIRGDHFFNNSSIIPEEDDLFKLFSMYRSVEGVKADNPHLCCLTHIYPASMKEIVATYKRITSELPCSFLPMNLRSSLVEQLI